MTKVKADSYCSTTTREELIEEAAKAIARSMPGWNDDTTEPDIEDARMRAHMESKWESVNAECMKRGREHARAALAVFEKAHTPTFTEALESLPAHEGCSGIGIPTGDEREAITDEALWDFAGDLLDSWNIEDQNPPSLTEGFRDRFVARFHRAYHPEPQGEPSDAQVRAAKEALGHGGASVTTPMMRAALRAAGGVR
jgi:hypothetical protein